MGLAWQNAGHTTTGFTKAFSLPMWVGTGTPMGIFLKAARVGGWGLEKIGPSQWEDISGKLMSGRKGLRGTGQLQNALTELGGHGQEGH